jgi:hypothetical protein
MNIHTFKDATTDRRSALANELADDGELGVSVLVYEMRFLYTGEWHEMCCMYY